MKHPTETVRLVAVAPTPSPDAERTFDVVACTSGVSDHRSRIDNAGWLLERFIANPVVLYGHADAPSLLGNVRPEDTLPIGKASNVRIDGDSLKASITFAPADVNPFAERVYRAFAGGYLNAVSVGFRPGSVTYEGTGKDEIAVLSGCELYEISVVPLPADAGAVAVRNASSIASFTEQARGTMAIKKNAADAAPPVEEKPAPPAPPVEQAAEVTCPECVAMNPAGSKFCNQCGESLQESAAEAPPGEQAAEPPGDAPPGKTLQSLTRQSTRAASLGVVLAWKLAAEALPAAQARIAELEGAKVSGERAQIIERLTAEKKLVPGMLGWAQSCELAGLKAFAAVAAPVTALAKTAPLSPPSGEKAWEAMSNMERHALHTSNPEAFEALHTDFERRRVAGR